jgi:hypothetical protein
MRWASSKEAAMNVEIDNQIWHYTSAIRFEAWDKGWAHGYRVGMFFGILAGIFVGITIAAMIILAK